MNEILIDLSGIFSADEFYEYLGTKIDLPSYFGYNLDALKDVLTDISSETVIRIENTEETRAVMPKFIRGLERLSKDLESEGYPVQIII